jgi:general secretion pathway protein E
MDTPALPPLDPALVALLPYGFARTHGALVACAHDDEIEVWLREGAQPATLAELRRMLRRPLRTRLLDKARFEQALNLAYDHGEGNHAATLVGDLEQGMDLHQLAQDIPEVADLLESEDDAPIIRLLNALLAQALRERASDIHIEPYETRSVVRFRLDGALRDVIEPKRALHAAIVSRIKVMAQLDIAEKRLPQDGRITLRLGSRPVDVRVSTLPTGHGERVVMRLLDKQAGRLELGRLGMNETTLASLDALIHRPHGIILVTGPTGSGKTTTLYAALSRLDARTHNIMTVEDPVEYDLDGIGQTQVNPRIELDFARALRAILRQDPDVIMIGEIRDLETAQIAVQASLTGHLVLATLHTNDAASSVTRLVDMGIEPFLLASSLLGVLGQRLVRRLCQACRAPHVPDVAERTLVGSMDANAPLYRAVGCPVCNGTGYRGRAGIYELLVVDEVLRRMIHDGDAEQALRAHAVGKGMIGLREDGMRWVRSGETALEEVLRATREG